MSRCSWPTGEPSREYLRLNRAGRIGYWFGWALIAQGALVALAGWAFLIWWEPWTMAPSAAAVFWVLYRLGAAERARLRDEAQDRSMYEALEAFRPPPDDRTLH